METPTAPTPAPFSDVEVSRGKCFAALSALFIAVEGSVARDVNDKVTDYILRIEKRANDATALRKALVQLVGVETKEELDRFERLMKMFPADDADRNACIAAIQAIRDTTP